MKTSRRKAFTLVELLVVIGIIALLISILLPTLRRAKESAMRALCMSNHRQLMIAVIMYTSDWKGTLPFCNWGGGDANGVPGWPGWLYWEKYRKTPGGGNSAARYVESDVETGVLWKYLRNRKVYRCPFQNVEDVIFKTSSNIMTSYNMNGATYAYGAGTGTGAVGVRPPAWKIGQMTAFIRDSVCFWETTEAIEFAWNDGSNFPMDSEGLSKRHGAGGSVISCFDGHAEFITLKEFTRLYNVKPGRLWCNPGSRNGDNNGPRR